MNASAISTQPIVDDFFTIRTCKTDRTTAFVAVDLIGTDAAVLARVDATFVNVVLAMCSIVT